MGRVRVALCQLDTVVGDVDGNVERVIEALAAADEAGCDLAAFPELSLTGYPPEDLLLKPAFVSANLLGLERVTAATEACAAIVGFVDLVGARLGDADARLGRAGREEAMRGDPRRLRNAAAVCCRGRVAGVYHKRRLPNYAVFDEERWFAPGAGDLLAVEVAGVTVGVSICEDLWFPGGPVADLGAGGAQLVINLNASPYSIGRRTERLEVLADRVAEAHCAICYVNQVGGQDELVFDGGSVVMDRTGSIVAEAVQFSEEILVTDIEVPDEPDRPVSAPVSAPVSDVSSAPVSDAARATVKVVSLSSAPRDAVRRPAADRLVPLEPDAEVYEALRIGTRDYMRKNGFTDALIGLSGGIDSSLVATIAVDALGAEHVHGVAMPSRYSSEGSVVDAEELARNLGIRLHVVPIEEAHVAFGNLLARAFDKDPVGLTDENLQSRIRGVILMAFSNAHSGWIVLTTGNKSELATGYSTLYGDSAGGFAVIKDVPKTLVYALCEYRNASSGRDLIPRSVLDKPPSAELRPDQRDDQSLPPYDILDPLLAGVVEQDESVADLVATGVDPELAARVAQLVDAAEYKRRQSPPGVRITVRAFGKDRRMPITNRFREGRPDSDNREDDVPQVEAGR
jgi:NAD+ synthase (glutamine-hydrolysing)